MSAADLATLRDQLRDRYTIERELGRGGMGAVYLARELGLDWLVALKVLPPSFAGDRDLRERFLRETRTAASFSHPNIVPVHAVEERGDLLAFAMGFVEGESLAERVQRTGPLGAREAVRLMLDVAYALSYAHGRGVVHRDIKPDNIMIERATGRALVMDFGISRRIDAAPVAGRAGLTRVGEVVGTPEYMSPEQASGDDVDGRSDLYSLGLVAWFALTGTTAVTADSTQKVLVKHITETLPPIASARPDLPAALTSTVDRCVAKDPAARFPDGGALAEALEAAQQAAPELPVPLRLLALELGAVVQVLLFAGLLGFFMLARANEEGFEHLDNLVPLVLLFAVVVTRVVQVVIEVSRVMRDGYSSADLRRGLLAIMDEALSLREARKLDAALRARRRRTVRQVAIQLAVAAGLVALALSMRAPNGLGGHRMPPLAVSLLFSGLALVGVSLVLALRSPFRMPPGERFFRAFWLGVPGRMVFALAERNAGGSQGTAGVSSRADTTSPPKPAASPLAERPRPDPAAEIARSTPATADLTGRVDELERRVDALESSRPAPERG